MKYFLLCLTASLLLVQSIPVFAQTAASTPNAQNLGLQNYADTNTQPTDPYANTGCQSGDYKCLWQNSTQQQSPNSKCQKNDYYCYIYGPGTPLPAGTFTDPGLYITDPAINQNPYSGKTFIAEPAQTVQQMTPERAGEVLLIRIVNWVVTFLGLLAFAILVYAGFIWVTALDNEEAATKAKKMITEVVIGTIVVLSAYAIVFTIIGGRGKLFFY